MQKEKVIHKKDVINFFDQLAPSWDDGQIIEEDKINAILDYAEIKEGVSVLDVACGTGVLIPDYLSRKVKSVVGVDISEEMIKIARSKFDDKKVTFLCGDIEEVHLEETFDTCMIFNAFPHFVNPVSLVASLTGKIKEGGRLTVAHSMSRKQLDAHHSGSANKVSNGLMSEDELADIFSQFYHVDVKISNERMYVVSGIKRV